MKHWNEYINPNITIETFIDLLKRKEPFTYTRFGDGEFSAIFGMDGQNCDGQKYSAELGIDLEFALRRNQINNQNHRCFYGLVPVAIKIFGDRIDTYMKRLFRINPIVNQVKWVSGNILMEANRTGNIGQFLKGCRTYKTIYVGNSQLLEYLKYDEFLYIDHSVIIPSTNAFSNYPSVFEELKTMIEFLNYDNLLIGFSAGLLTKVLQRDILRYTKQVTSIDFGSMWDGYYGINSRKYHHDYDWQDIRERNLK